MHNVNNLKLYVLEMLQYYADNDFNSYLMTVAADSAKQAEFISKQYISAETQDEHNYSVISSKVVLENTNFTCPVVLAASYISSPVILNKRKNISAFYATNGTYGFLCVRNSDADETNDDLDCTLFAWTNLNPSYPTHHTTLYTLTTDVQVGAFVYYTKDLLGAFTDHPGRVIETSTVEYDEDSRPETTVKFYNGDSIFPIKVSEFDIQGKNMHAWFGNNQLYYIPSSLDNPKKATAVYSYNGSFFEKVGEICNVTAVRLIKNISSNSYNIVDLTRKSSADDLTNKKYAWEAGNNNIYYAGSKDVENATFYTKSGSTYTEYTVNKRFIFCGVPSYDAVPSWDTICVKIPASGSSEERVIIANRNSLRDNPTNLSYPVYAWENESGSDIILTKSAKPEYTVSLRDNILNRSIESLPSGTIVKEFEESDRPEEEPQ